MIDGEFESDSLELYFDNSDPLANIPEDKSPVIPRAPLPRRNQSDATEPTTAGRGTVRFEPHISPTTGTRQLPIITPVTVEPPYQLQSFQTYPKQRIPDVTSEAVFSHIISDLNNVMDTTDRYFMQFNVNVCNLNTVSLFLAIKS